MRFYRPGNQGYEAQVIERLERWRRAQLEALGLTPQEGPRLTHEQEQAIKRGQF